MKFSKKLDAENKVNQIADEYLSVSGVKNAGGKSMKKLILVTASCVLFAFSGVAFGDTVGTIDLSDGYYPEIIDMYGEVISHPEQYGIDSTDEFQDLADEMNCDLSCYPMGTCSECDEGVCSTCEVPLIDTSTSTTGGDESSTSGPDYGDTPEPLPEQEVSSYPIGNDTPDMSGGFPEV